MADTSVQTANRVQRWADEHFVEYVRMSPLKELMGEGSNAIIQVIQDLTKARGDRITVSLVTRLTGDGVENDSQLSGNEEALGNYGHLITVNQLRNGVVVGEYEQIKTVIDLLDAAKDMLRLWSMEKLRDLQLGRLMSASTTGLTAYSSLTEANKDAWEAANNPTDANQRILFGAAKSSSTLDHSAGLAEIDGTNDDLHQDIVSLMKRMAKTCDPHIRPHVVKETGEEVYVLLAGSLPFRDLQANMSTIHQNAAPRSMEDNPIFRDRDLHYDGVIIKEVPEMDRLTSTFGGCQILDAGASSIEVAATFLCGAQALGLAWAKRPAVRTDDWDYGNKSGVAVTEIRGCEKLTYNSFQHGVVTGYVSCVGD